MSGRKKIKPRRKEWDIRNLLRLTNFLTHRQSLLKELKLSENFRRKKEGVINKCDWRNGLPCKLNKYWL